MVDSVNVTVSVLGVHADVIVIIAHPSLSSVSTGIVSGIVHGDFGRENI
jgi:hypothetical protein